MSGAKSPAAPTKGAVSHADPEVGSGVPTEEGWYVLGLRSWQGQPPPRSNVTLGGFSFPEYAYDENPTVKGDTREYNQRRRGQRVYLDNYALTQIRDALGKKIVRTRSAKLGTYAILTKGRKAAGRPLRGDLPLERFIYIVPATDPNEDKAQEGEDNLPPPVG